MPTEPQKYEPFPVWRMRFCSDCGRNDLQLPLKERHFAGGAQCHGKLTTVTYVLTGKLRIKEAALDEILNCDKCDLCEDHHD